MMTSQADRDVEADDELVAKGHGLVLLQALASVFRAPQRTADAVGSDAEAAGDARAGQVIVVDHDETVVIVVGVAAEAGRAVVGGVRNLGHEA